MSLTLYYHPFSSYSQKAETAFYEKGVGFTAKVLDGNGPVQSEFAALWPIGRFPILVDGDRLVFEASGLIEYVEALYPGTYRLIPQDPLQAAEVRMWDRFFDNYVNYPQQRLVYAAIGREVDDGEGGAKWKAALDTAYAFLDRRMGRPRMGGSGAVQPGGLCGGALAPLCGLDASHCAAIPESLGLP